MILFMDLSGPGNLSRDPQGEQDPDLSLDTEGDTFAPVVEPEDADEPQYPMLEKRIAALRRQLAIERAVFIGLILLLFLTIYVLRRPGSAWLITVGGQPVVAVADREAAEGLLSSLRTAQAQTLADAEFAESVSIRRVSTTEYPPASPSAASAKLTKMLTLVVPAWAVVIDGKIAAGLPSRALAEQTVRALRSRSAGSLQVRQAKVPVAQYHRTAAEALRALAGGAAGTATYAVKDGDSAWIIADRLHTSVEELQLLNPGVDLENLQIGQQLRVARQGAPPNTPR